jgi:hypothetical protein
MPLFEMQTSDKESVIISYIRDFFTLHSVIGYRYFYTYHLSVLIYTFQFSSLVFSFFPSIGFLAGALLNVNDSIVCGYG